MLVGVGYVLLLILVEKNSLGYHLRKKDHPSKNSLVVRPIRYLLRLCSTYNRPHDFSRFWIEKVWGERERERFLQIVILIDGSFLLYLCMTLVEI